MTIEFDRRHAFYLDAEGTLHIFCPYRLDRLWRGEPDATEPQLANQCIRFAIFHIERFTSPPRVILEYYPSSPSTPTAASTSTPSSNNSKPTSISSNPPTMPQPRPPPPPPSGIPIPSPVAT